MKTRILAGLTLSFFCLISACTEIKIAVSKHIDARVIASKEDPSAGPVSQPAPGDIESLKKLQEEEIKEITLGGGTYSCDPRGQSRLTVTPTPQETMAWCWAASSQAILDFYGIKKEQCSLVSEYTGASCCPTSTDLVEACWSGGWPENVLEEFRFEYYTVPRVFDWDALTKEICLKHPFIFVVQWTGGGLHSLIARGYNNVISIITEVPSPTSTNPNPLPVYTDTSRQIVEVYDHTADDFFDATYEEFVGDISDGDEYGHVHYVDYGRIRPQK